MRFVKISAILSTVTNLGCIRKRIFDGTGFSKNIEMHLFFVLFSLQFHEASTMFGSKNFQTFYKRTLCGHSL